MTMRLERSVLLVPGSNPAMIAKAAARDADAVCIDLEDAVTVDEKEAARTNACTAFADLDFGRSLRMVRINGLDTSLAYRDLVQIVEHVGDNVDIVVVPKVDTPGDVQFVDRLLTGVEQHRGLERRIGIEALIETAAGGMNVREIAASSERLEALVFGSGDYAASMQMPSEVIGGLDDNDAAYPGHRWHHIMHAIVGAARAHGKRAIDGPFAGVRDLGGLEQACRIGRVMGFDGKWCIHPSQVAAVNSTFVPSRAELDRAQAVVTAYEVAVAEGKGAVTVDSRMVDVASLRMSRMIVDRARLAGLIASTADEGATPWQTS